MILKCRLSVGTGRCLPVFMIGVARQYTNTLLSFTLWSGGKEETSVANKHPVLCNGVQSEKLMMVDLTNTKLIETGLKSYERDTRGLFCSKTRTRN